MLSAKPQKSPGLLGLVGLLAANFVLQAMVRDQRRAEPSDTFGKPSSRSEPLTHHVKRAAEHGRGREAIKPWQIPWRGWKDILWRTFEEVQNDRLLAIAAGVVFYALLAIFPAITALVSMYGLFTPPATINQHLVFLSDVMPEGGVSIVSEQIDRVAAKGDVKLGFGFIFGLAIAIWSANAGIKAVIDALNVVYEEDEKRGFFKLNLISLGFTVAALVAILIGIAMIVVVPLLLDRVGLGTVATIALEYGRWPGLVLALIASLAVLYRFGPSRAQPRWQWLSVGSILATILWIAGSALLSHYLRKYANYDATYGSLGAAIGMMMWMWMSAIVVLLGAEINAEVEHQTAADTTVGAPRPMGTREAAMADTIGAAKS
ncbi:MAG: YihY/virulence factor BrkB family protein [Xanthobacteraceae bacterium]